MMWFDDDEYGNYDDSEPTEAAVFKSGNWPFGVTGKPDDVLVPKGAVCAQISNILGPEEEQEEAAGEYSFGGQAESLPVAPGLFVTGVGSIALPLCPEQADKLIAICDKSPFGRKLDTMMDENVRKGWQLAPDQVDVKSPLWSSGLDKLSETVADRLGYKGVPLQCKLYKLLVYGEGGHFVKHQDTEKEDGMIATMVVQLPSLHEGGDLVVYRGGEVKHRHDFGKKDSTAAYLPHYAVHYADAEHALEKVTKGYRLVLIYSICLPSNMRHLMKTMDDTLSDELSRAITRMDDGDNTFALLLSHEYTEASIEELGTRALTDLDRSRLQILQEANSVAAPGKKLQFFITKLSHNIKYWADGHKWEEEERNESITWYSLNGGEKLGHSSETKFPLNLLNPGCESFSGLWARHGESVFEEVPRDAKRKTTYSRFGIVAWPVAKGVEKAFSFIGVNADVKALQAVKTVNSATIRKFMDDAIDKLESMKVLCGLLVDANDAALVSLYFSNFWNRITGKKEELVGSLAALVDNFEWSDIGQTLLASLKEMDEIKSCDDISASGLELTLRLVDSLNTGTAQHALLDAAVEQSLTLDEEDLCSPNVNDLLWKWAIQCGDNVIFNTVASKFKRLKPSLLKPAIEAFSQHLDKLDASEEKFDVLASIVQARIKWIKRSIEKSGQAILVGNAGCIFPRQRSDPNISARS
ncbi:hypothetical protein PR003_g9770 [Phytophthora rubi]|uniref:Fe2OG dioxygenase domain-containing protein n=1 Tax=Phytophthora rubi TaxID=129364 RepID=A0A6A4FRA5_9STRA|nr:hypothetical protein PR001_g9080 [Phytophthora rubi]KAE9341854.1 hypothetical protein PR003_g9770 [Phytophthora rubi]